MDNKKTSTAAGLRDEELVSEYFLVRQQLERTKEEVRHVVQRPENCLPYIKVRACLTNNSKTETKKEAQVVLDEAVRVRQVERKALLPSKLKATAWKIPRLIHAIQPVTVEATIPQITMLDSQSRTL